MQNHFWQAGTHRWGSSPVGAKVRCIQKVGPISFISGRRGFFWGIFSVGRWSPFWFLHILARLFSRIKFGIVHAHACPRASLLLASSLSRLGPAGFQFPHGPHSARSWWGHRHENSLLKVVAIFPARKLQLPADGMQNHPHILLLRVICNVL